ncbi:MAG: 50S ribosomal protein L24 [Alphaproteobacteria bacterium]|nr:50S ribosomal protein L24 [Alphaproteobacteria bacterium]
MLAKTKIKKGDQVILLSGKDKGRKGEVLKVLREESRVIVQGINMVKRHTKQSARSTGGILEKESSVHISNVAHIDPSSNKPTRVGYKTLSDGRKVRFAKKSGETIDR